MAMTQRLRVTTRQNSVSALNAFARSETKGWNQADAMRNARQMNMPAHTQREIKIYGAHSVSSDAADAAGANTADAKYEGGQRLHYSNLPTTS